MAGTRSKIGFRIESAAVAELVGKIANIDRKVARAALKKGINEASKLVLDAAKNNVPVRTGQLKKSLGRKVRSVKNGAVVYAVIKPRAGTWVKATDANVAAGRSSGKLRMSRDGKRVLVRNFRKDFGAGIGVVNPVYYAHLVEFGRREVVAGTAKGKATGKKVLAGHGKVYGRRVRSMAPRPFLRPAWEDNKDRVVGIILAALNRGLREFFSKYRSRRAA